MYTGPNTVNDGLVFGYDTGYGVADNETSTRFYPGEPTENLIHDMGGAVTSAYPEVAYRCTANETNVADTSAPGGKYSRFTGIDDSSNNQLYSRFNSYSIDVRGDSVNYSVYLKGSGTCHLTIYDNNSGYGISPTITLTDEWVRYNYTRSVSASATTYWVAVRGVLNTTNVYIAGQQATRGIHSTPYIENNRSSTQSLIDLKRTTDIDVSSLSFDSTGQPNYDGTDEYINLGNYTALKLGFDFSLEFVVKPEQDKWMYFFHKGYGANNALAWGRHSSADNWFFSTMTGGSYQNSYMGTATLNKYCHLVATYDGTNLRLYENGILKVTSAMTHQMMDTNTSAGIGGPDRYWNGEIPVTKVYNKVLSTQEVQQNFNAYKNRFNI
jgi:hypothetical protein